MLVLLIIFFSKKNSKIFLKKKFLVGQNTPHENAINLAVLGLAYFSLGEQTDDGKYRVRVK